MSGQRCTKCGHESHVDGAVCTQCGAPYPVPTGEAVDTFNLHKGEVIANRYTVQGIVGRGGMGCIYKVFDNTLDEVVALKTLLPEYVREKMVVERFFNEARIARGLSHPNIVRVHDIGRSSNGMVYISMEMVGGRSLRSLIDKLRPGQRLPTNAVLRMFDGLCAALEYAHQYTIHRDLKPENVMVQKDGSIKLMDFGISKLMANPNLTSASMVMGTPHYMSPEQLKNTANVDARADIYSLGIMLYEVLTGDKPMGGKAASETVHDVPASLDPIIGKCLKGDPGQRYQTMAELRKALKDIRVQLETGAPLEPIKNDFSSVKPLALEPERSKGRMAIAMVGVVLVLIVVLGGFNWAERRKEVESSRSPSAANDGNEPSGEPIIDVVKADAMTFGELTSVVNALKMKTENYLRSDPDSDPEWVASKLEELDSQWQRAMQADAGQKLVLGWHATHQYLGILLGPQMNEMLFVPPSGGVAGFFIDTSEVTVDVFNRFVVEQKWRALPATGDPTYPVVYVKYYDAMGFARHQTIVKTLPTREQYRRAFSHAKAAGILMDSEELLADGVDAPFRVWGSISEWTSSIHRDVDGNGEPWFGDSLFVARIQGATSQEYTALYDSSHPFGSSHNQLGFRCVYALPETMEDLRSIMALL